MSIASVVTRGFIGGVKFIPTRGYVAGAPAPTPTPDTTGHGAYVTPYQKYRQDQYELNEAAKLRAELKRIDDELAEAEQRKAAAQKRAKAKLLAEKAAKKLAALEAQLLEEISVLRIERVRLMRRIDDEEAVLVLLMSMPFH